MKHRTFTAALALSLCAWGGTAPATAATGAAVTEPAPAAAYTVEGPIATVGTPAQRNYPFSAAIEDLGAAGYVEHEYFIAGQAHLYNVANLATAGVIVGGLPYRSRVLVRRPANAAAFNGAVIVEWLNVTAGFDNTPGWTAASAELMARGYAWVGVSAQQAGVEGPQGLRNWSPQRYGTLHVSMTGTMAEDALGYDIFSHVAQALRAPSGTVLLGGLRPQQLIASGTSQSARKLAYFLNGVHPLQPVFDAAVLDGAMGDLVRSELDIKIGKILTESDLTGGGEAQVRRPDSSRYVSWEIAGASHVSANAARINNARRLRDLGPDAQLDASQCALPPFSHVPNYQALGMFYEHVRTWVVSNQPPPSFAPIALRVNARQLEVERDADGIAIGGVRLPAVVVPVATDTGQLNRGKLAADDRACRMRGSHQPWPAEKLAGRYGSPAHYRQLLDQAVRASAAAGVISPAAAAATLRQGADVRW